MLSRECFSCTIEAFAETQHAFVQPPLLGDSGCIDQRCHLLHEVLPLPGRLMLFIFYGLKELSLRRPTRRRKRFASLESLKLKCVRSRVLRIQTLDEAVEGIFEVSPEGCIRRMQLHM